MSLGPLASGAANSFDIEQCARDIDRKIQGKMYKQNPLNNWAIFHGDRDAQVANSFSSTMKQCLETCGYESTPPKICAVKPGMRADAWVRELQNQLDQGCQMVVLLLPGSKGRCPCYDDVKKFLLTEFPIPSQVVLTSTIQRGKNLRSIVSKILI